MKKSSTSWEKYDQSLKYHHQSAPKNEEDASKKNFQFWSTQPVSTCFSKFSRWIVFLGLTYGMSDHETSQIVDMFICARCRPWRRWSPRTSASARMSQQRRSETFPVVKQEIIGTCNLLGETRGLQPSRWLQMGHSSARRSFGAQRGGVEKKFLQILSHR